MIHNNFPGRVRIFDYRTASKRGIAIIAAMLATSPALSQMTNCMANGPFMNCNSTNGAYTTCNTTGDIVNCNTMGGYQQPPLYGHQNTPSANGSPAGQMVDFFRSIKERRVQSKVAKALKAGDCTAAVEAAFKSSNVNFALDVQTYCARYAANSPSR